LLILAEDFVQLLVGEGLQSFVGLVEKIEELEDKV